MSYHAECGEAVHWARRADDPGRYLPPLEFMAMAVVLDEDGVGRTVATYQQHRCDPAKVRAWQDYQVEMANALGGAELPYDDRSGELQTLARGRAREATYAEAMEHGCPSCAALPGERCINKTVLKQTGELVPTKDAHAMRMRLVTA